MLKETKLNTKIYSDQLIRKNIYLLYISCKTNNSQNNNLGLLTSFKLFITAYKKKKTT